MDRCVWPSSGRLFPSKGNYAEKKTKKDHIGYHAVYSAVTTLFKRFQEKCPDKACKWERVRAHSGRATRITLLMGEGVSLSMSMSFARHAADSVRTHLNYGKLTVSQVHKYLMEERERQQRLLVQPARAPLMCERRNGLEGVGLKELVEYLEKGHLAREEFNKLKNKKLPCTQ